MLQTVFETRAARRCAVVLTLFVLLKTPVSAGTITFTDPVSFMAALPGSPMTLNFDSLPVGTAIPSGSSVGGVTFTYSLTGLTMEVVNDFNTTSGSNSLGLNNPANFNQFIAGDEFDLGFPVPTRAVGMFFITTPDLLLPGDIRLVTAVGTARNAGVPNLILPDGGTTYFVGLVSDGAFATTQVRFDPGALGTFLYNVDDITLAAVPVPEPVTGLICGTVLWLLSVWHRSLKQSGKEHSGVERQNGGSMRKTIVILALSKGGNNNELQEV